MRLNMLTLACKGLLINDRCHVRFATLVDRNVLFDMNQLENCQARYRSNTWMGRIRTDGPDEFEPSKFDCIFSTLNRKSSEINLKRSSSKTSILFTVTCNISTSHTGITSNNLGYVQSQICWL